MRELILLRHAHAEPAAQGQADLDRPLSAEGLAEAEADFRRRFAADPAVAAGGDPWAALEAVQSPHVADYNRVSAERFMKTLDRHLEGRDFIAADRFTIADIVLGHCLHWAERYERPVSQPILRDYLARVEARPVRGGHACRDDSARSRPGSACRQQASASGTSG